ncbi:thiol-activated cytolysin family protein [Pectobacterium sp. B1J-3]|uniref:thiol-activated cytolysin family protein n=1 Tax=Pectobacterium sp. B1J-3 TaxID=3385371 RepID=UPI0039062B27
MKDIDKKIAELHYDEKAILAYTGERLSSFKAVEGTNEGNGKYIVVKRERKSIHNEGADIAVIESLKDIVHPGALLLANARLIENNPTSLVVARKPMTFKVDLPGMGSEALFTVDNPTSNNVAAKLDEVLTCWNEKYAQKYEIAARMHYNSATVFNESQLCTQLGLEIKGIAKKLNIDFSSTSKNKHSVAIATFRQIFYTVSTSFPLHPSDLFADEVSWEDLSQNVDNKNPPLLVNSVAYGRTIYVKIETSSSNTNVKAALDAALSGNSAKISAEHKALLENAQFTVFVLGGGTSKHIGLISVTNIDDVKRVITENATYSNQNPGYPIGYSCVFLKNNQIALINSTAEYIETTYSEYSSGQIKLKHTGGYVAQFRVTWDEITGYTDQGHPITVARGWGDNQKDRTAPFNTVIPLNGNCTNISIFAKECTGLPWEWWRTVVDYHNVPLVPERTVHISGTTLQPSSSVTPGI